MLDCGHLLFYGIEAIRGRPLSERAQELGFRIGLAIVEVEAASPAAQAKLVSVSRGRVFDVAAHVRRGPPGFG